MVSVKTLDNTLAVEKDELKVKQSDLQNRTSVDLVCVIDNSGSMSGEKIENVKKALIALLDFMEDNDRLCLILFNSYGQRLTNLKCTNKKNKEELIRIINSLRAGGGTNINSGMDIAFRVLKGRKHENPVSSVFLLSDG